MSECSAYGCKSPLIPGRVDGALQNAAGEAFCSPQCKTERADELAGNGAQCAHCWAPARKGPSPCMLDRGGEAPLLHFCCDEHRTEWVEAQRKGTVGGRPTRYLNGPVKRVSVGLSREGALELERRALEANSSQSVIGSEILEAELLGVTS